MRSTNSKTSSETLTGFIAQHDVRLVSEVIINSQLSNLSVELIKNVSIKESGVNVPFFLRDSGEGQQNSIQSISF